MYISVSGAASCGREIAESARRVGRLIAEKGHVLVCGGLGGVMDAAARGASEAGGISVGILPGYNRDGSSQWLTVSIPTDMGHARNALVALAADSVIAVSGSYGTLSEIAFALKMGKPVVGLSTWDLPALCVGEEAVAVAATPDEAVELAERLTGRKS